MFKLCLFLTAFLTATPAFCEDFPVERLNGKKIGVQLGTTGDMLVSDMKNVTAERYNKTGDALQSLLNGKIDFVIDDEQPAKAFVAKNKALTILPEILSDEEYAIAVKKSNRTLKKQIDDALTELKERGVLDEIVKNHIGPESGKHPTRFADAATLTNGVLTAATNATYPPYEYFRDNRIVGIDIDIIRSVAERLGKKLRLVDMEFDAIIPSVQSGKVDVGISAISVTPDRLKNVAFSVPYTHSRQVVVVLNGSDEALKTSFSLKREVKDAFVTDGRWRYLAKGLENTLLMAFFSAILGFACGTLMALARVFHDKEGAFPILNAFVRLYLALMRGTPLMIQLLLMYYVVFAAVDINKIVVAVLCFGLNSAAYVAEIVRAGIFAVDNGQFEAARSLGFNSFQAMRFVVFPQALKNVLPALANEFVSLVKETSICGYIGLLDLTRGGDIIRSVTYDAVLPLGAVALIYLVLVSGLTGAIRVLEQRMKKNER